MNFRSNFFIKLSNWEYWPMWLVYFFVFFYYLYLSFKARSFFFFSASNPGIEGGGMLGESKWEVLKLIPKQYTAKTVLLRPDLTFDEAYECIKQNGLDFPMVLKPDNGERGWMVKKINNLYELKDLWKIVKITFLAQEFIDYPQEYGLFYYRFPGSSKGVISSLTGKRFLKLTGTGKDSWKEVAQNHGRAGLYLKTLANYFGPRWNQISEKNCEEYPVFVGNHCRGTAFVNETPKVTDSLIHFFDGLVDSIDGFYFGRFDLRCTSLEDLAKGKNFAIVELNGAGSEPAHIYETGFSFFEGQKVLWRHWSVLYEISKINRRKGISYMTFSQAKALYLRSKTTKKIQAGD